MNKATGLIPQEFLERELFNKFIQNINYNKTYIGEQFFPVREVFSTFIQDVIVNASYEVYIKGVANPGDSSYNIDNLGSQVVQMGMFDYIIDRLFTGKDFAGINGLGGIVFYGSQSEAEARQIEISKFITRNVEDMIDAIRRFWEYVRWEAVLKSGVIDLKNNTKGIHFHYDFKVPAALKVAANTLDGNYIWTNNTDGKSDPLSDIETKRIKLKEAGARGPFEIWANSNTWRVFVANTKVAAANILSDRMKEIIVGGNYENIPVKGCALKTFDGMYKIEGASSMSYYLPDGYVIIKSTGALGETQYGTSEIPANDDRNIIRVSGMYAYSLLEKNPAALQVIHGVKGAVNYQYVNDALVMKVY